MDGHDIEIDGGDVERVLIVDAFLSECLCEGNDHRPTAHTGLVYADEPLFRDQVLRIMGFQEQRALNLR